MYDFAYHKAATLDEVRAKWKEGDDPILLAGGMTLIPTMKQRLAMPSDVIDLGAINDLRQIRRDGDGLTIGAMATHASVAASQDVLDHCPALACLAAGIGDPAVRNRGTLGGSIANADPAADYPAALLGLGATVVTTDREISADDFFVDLFETALEDGEIITAVRFPAVKRAAYAKFANPASRYAIVGVFIGEGDAGLRVAVTGAGAKVFRFSAAEEALANGQALDGLNVEAERLNNDIHASREYRAHLVGVMTRRAAAGL